MACLLVGFCFFAGDKEMNAACALSPAVFAPLIAVNRFALAINRAPRRVEPMPSSAP